MSSNPQLSQAPIHSGTRQYIDRKVVEMEERLARGMVNRIAEMEARLTQGNSELVYRINEIAGEIESLKQAPGSIETFIDSHLSSKIRYSPKQAHTASEIRDLIRQNGHRVVVSEPFNCKQYAIQLEKVVELRAGDRAVQGGQIVFRKRVQTTMCDWVNSEKAGKLFCGNCPFEKIGRFEYAVKEAWQWPDKAA